MTIEAISFLIGGILIGTAIVGGGFEIKEIKMPRVGAGVRLVSLVVGSAFVMLGLGIWGVNNPQLLADQVPVNAMMPANGAGQAIGQTSSLPEAQTREAALPEVKQEAVQPPREQAEWVQPVVEDESVFTGFEGDSHLSWDVAGIPIRASARFAGMSGMIRIGWVDPETGMQDEVLQDLVLRQDNNGVIFYQGSNPRDPSTQQPRKDYAPDRFRIVPSPEGWTIDQICDTQACWPVTVR